MCIMTTMNTYVQSKLRKSNFSKKKNKNGLEYLSDENNHYDKWKEEKILIHHNVFFYVYDSDSIQNSLKNNIIGRLGSRSCINSRSLF